MKILVVDDQKDNRQLLEAFLTEYGHQVVQAANGKEALDQLRNQHFNLVISDILMPGMDGFQLCRSVKKDELLKDIPFVFYTASYVEKEDEELALRFGADEFLRQPVDPEELEAIIKRLAREEESRGIQSPVKKIENGQDVFKLYNERLLHKLENKVSALEREIAERKRVEEELKKYRDQLAELVEESTIEFKQINLQLEQEIADRREIEEALQKSYQELEARVEERTRELTEANLKLQKEIIERNQARAEIVKEKEKAQQYLDIAGVMIVVVNSDQTVGLINKKGCEILGYGSEEIIGKNWFDHFLPPEIRETVRVVFVKIMKGDVEPVEYFENSVLNKAGKERLIAWHNALIKDEEGRVLNTLSSGADITDRKKSEEMMIQAEKMATVGSLAAGMAHEINNPLAGILQGIQVIRGRISPDSQDNRNAAEECGTTIEAVNAYLDRRKIKKFLDSAGEAGERAAAIVENMLSFSRKSESTFALNDIGELLDKTVILAENEYDLKKKYDFRQITIVREYDPDLPNVPCEATKIRQVILNLLKNAAQAIHQCDPPSGPKEPRIILRTSRKNDMICIDVEDNGPGMPDDVRRRIFEPFYTTKNVGDGTGLGLSISYFIITRDHGGTMEVHSTPGRGTTFTIRLPLGDWRE